jgi:hypothetical protein
MIRGIAQCFARKFEEEAAGFSRVGGRIVIVPGTLSFAWAAERGRRRERTGGFRRGFFERATGGHERVWREKGFERKEKFFGNGRGRCPNGPCRMIVHGRLRITAPTNDFMFRSRPHQTSIPISFVLAQEKNKKFVYNMTGVIPINL